MAISDSLLRRSIVILAGVEGVDMDPDALVEDVVLLAHAFPDEKDFGAAVLNTQKALTQIRDRRVSSSSLLHNHLTWFSYHYQHSVSQGQRADMRIEWQPREGGIRVRGFGHRWIPSHFYERMARTRRVE
ncbi:MAG: hypothetical protein IKG18_09085 [Atopobiaceae bacterium]|nr:hypothetical protein [Atopobiaceae bacterium]MBR3314276.1 hypothetical protein [Atopobiaceae bacterium]